jgi:hypothetical protein
MVDSKQSRLFYGDPFGSQQDPETKKALEWWTHHHTGRRFSWGILEVPTQKDGFNCGILSHSGLSHRFLPNTPLVNGNGKGPADTRLEMMLRVINKYNRNLLTLRMPSTPPMLSIMPFLLPRPGDVPLRAGTSLSMIPIRTTSSLLDSCQQISVVASNRPIPPHLRLKLRQSLIPTGHVHPLPTCRHKTTLQTQKDRLHSVLAAASQPYLR